MSQIVLNSIKGSVNVITGCGSGLGKATLEWFLKRGSGPILAIDRQYPKDFESSLNITNEERKNLYLRTHDTFDVKQVESSLEEFMVENNTGSSIDNLINVAGVSLGFTLYTDSNRAIYELCHAKDLAEFNTVGTFNMIRSAARYMIDDKITDRTSKNKSKCIVNTSCISTTKPSVSQTFYAASKSAIDSMTLCIAREFAPFNIRCNTINVGYFDTKLVRASEDKVTNHLVAMSLCPKRLGHVDEFAHLVQAICENHMLNGACIKIDACAQAAYDKPTGKVK